MLNKCSNLDDLNIFMFSERNPQKEAQTVLFHYYNTLGNTNQSIVTKSRSVAIQGEDVKGQTSVHIKGPEENCGDNSHILP